MYCLKPKKNNLDSDKTEVSCNKGSLKRLYLLKNVKSRRHWDDKFKALKEKKNLLNKNYMFRKTVFKNEGRINTFLNKQQLSKIFTSRFSLK